MTRLLIADDHAVVRKGMIQILQDAGLALTFDEVADGQAALAALRDGRYDIALLDISMPGKSGVDVLRHYYEGGGSTPILVLSMYPEAQYALRLIRAGAAGYLTKDSAPDQLASAVKMVLAGKRYISPEVAELMAESLSQRLNNADEPDHQQLSDREFQVFLQLARGLGPTEIGQAMNLSAKTITTYRSRIMQKLGMRTNADLTLYANRHQLL